MSGLKIVATEEDSAAAKVVFTLDGGNKLVVEHVSADSPVPPILEVLAELNSSSSEKDGPERVVLHENATLLLCRNEDEIPTKVADDPPKNQSVRRDDAPSVSDIRALEAELLRRELASLDAAPNKLSQPSSARRRAGGKSPPPPPESAGSSGTLSALATHVSRRPPSLDDGWWSETLEPFVEKATAAARDDFRHRDLGAACHRLCRRIVEAVARRLAHRGAVDATVCRVLSTALTAGGAVASERVAWCSANPQTATTSVKKSTSPVDAGANTSSDPPHQQNKSRFFGRLGGGGGGSYKAAVSSSGNHTNSLETRPLRRPPRASHQQQQESEWVSPIEPILGGQPPWIELIGKRKKTAASVDSKDAWPLDDCSESDGDESEFHPANNTSRQSRGGEATLDNRSPIRFAKFASQQDGAGCFFCGDAALALRRAREKISDDAPLSVDDAVGTGLLLDHFVRSGGLDAYVARFSGKFVADADQVTALLDALTPAFSRAAPATSLVFSRQVARAIQRAVNSRIRALARRERGDLDAARLALARLLSKLSPDAFIVASATGFSRGTGGSGHPASNNPQNSAMLPAAGFPPLEGPSRNRSVPPAGTLSGTPRGSGAAAGSAGGAAVRPSAWKSYWTSSTPSAHSTPVDIACRAARASAERLELDVAKARLFYNGDDEGGPQQQRESSTIKLRGVTAINAIAASFAGSIAQQHDEAAAVGKSRPNALSSKRQPPPWLILAPDSDASARGEPWMMIDWQIGEAMFASWLARHGIPAAIIDLAARRREALSAGLEALSLAARCGPFSPHLVDSLAKLCVKDAATVEGDDDAPGSNTKASFSTKAWVSLASRLPLELVARQRDALSTAYRRKDAEPTAAQVVLVSSFAKVAAPRLLRAAAQADSHAPNTGSGGRPSAPFQQQSNRYLEGGLDLLWRWTVRDVPIRGCECTSRRQYKYSGRRQAAKALANVLRRPASMSLDRSSGQCAELCVERLEQRPASHSTSEGVIDDGGCGDRVCRLLAALVVPTKTDVAQYIYARRKSIERRRGPLVQIARRRVLRDAREGRDPRCALRLVLALAADHIDSSYGPSRGDDYHHHALPGAPMHGEQPPKYMFDRLTMEDVGLLSRFASAAFFAVAAERRALESRAAEKALLDLSAADPTEDEPRAAVALFETAMLCEHDDDDDESTEVEKDRRGVALVDALVLVVLRGDGSNSSVESRCAPLLGRVARSPPARTRVSIRCVVAVQDASSASARDGVSRRAAALVAEFFRAAGPGRCRLVDEDADDAVRWVAALEDQIAPRLRLALSLARGDEAWRSALASRAGIREKLAVVLLSESRITSTETSLALKVLDATLIELRYAPTDGGEGNGSASFWCNFFPTLEETDAKETFHALVVALVDRVANHEDSTVAALATRFLLCLTRFEARTARQYHHGESVASTLVIDTIAGRPSFARALRRALLPPPREEGVRSSPRESRDRCRLRGEAFGLARETVHNPRAADVVMHALLEPLGEGVENYDRDAYSRCSELVAALFDEIRAQARRNNGESSMATLKEQPYDVQSLGKVAEKLATDVVKRRSNAETRAEDEEACHNEAVAAFEDDYDDDEEEHADSTLAAASPTASSRTGDAAFFAADAFATDDEDENGAKSGMKDGNSGRQLTTHRSPATPKVAATTLERSRLALLGALLRFGARPSKRVVTDAARHLAARCELGGTSFEGAEAPFLDGDEQNGIAAAATRAVAVDTLAALCEASTDALGEVCGIMAKLHQEDDGFADEEENESSVPVKLEAADVIRSAQTLQQHAASPLPTQQLSLIPRNRNIAPPPPVVGATSHPHHQHMPDFVGGSNSNFTSRFSSIIVPPKRPMHGYAGLENLGCTCYLNSTLQLLSSAQAFRGAVYALDPARSDDNHKELAKELQLLVARLAARDAASISPRTFCDAFKTWDGEPIDVRQQQDASEFIANLFQQLERMAVRPEIGTEKGISADQSQEGSFEEESTDAGQEERSTAASRLERAFGGVFAHELSALSDPAQHNSRRDEPFYLLSVQVKDRSRLENALQAFVAPEIVEYAWRDGGRREKTSKGVTIRKAPRHLLIHLKRFEFDLETLTQRKINSRFEFPQSLDLAPFTTKPLEVGEDSDPENYEVFDPPERKSIMYDLGGVVVHAGTAHSGHYYSFVREQDGQWFEFNDSYVAPFDAENELAAECFGGTEPPPARQPPSSSSSAAPPPPGVNHYPMRERTRNAFLLVYHRRHVTPNDKSVIEDVDEPPQLTKRTVAVENEALRKARATFDETSLAFAASLVEKGLHSTNGDKTLKRRAASLGAALCVRTLIRAREDDASALLAKCATAVASALAHGDAEDTAIRLLLGPAEKDKSQDAGPSPALVDALRRAAAHPDESAREAMCGLFAAALRALHRSSGDWRLRSTSHVALRGARALVAVAAGDDRELLANRSSLLGPQKRAATERQPTAPRRDREVLPYGDVQFERGPSRAACDALSMFASADNDSVAWLAKLETEKKRTALVDLINAAVANTDGAVRTSRRRLAAFVTRVDLIARLATNLGSFESARLGDVAVATVVACSTVLVDRGRYSKKADEGRRRASAAREVLELLVKEDPAKSKLAISTIIALMQRCLLGLAASRRRRAMLRRSARITHEKSDMGRSPPPSFSPANDDDDDDEILDLDTGMDAVTSLSGSSSALEPSTDIDEDPRDELDDTHQTDEDDLEDQRERFSYSTDLLRRCWRALACVIAVDDSLRSYRVATGISRALAATERCCARRVGQRRKLCASIEELLRLCKRDTLAKEWVRSHRQTCDWLLELASREFFPSHDSSDSSNFNFVGASLDTLRAPLGAVASGVRSWTGRRSHSNNDLQAEATPPETRRRREDRRTEDLSNRIKLLLQYPSKNSPRVAKQRSSERIVAPPQSLSRQSSAGSEVAHGAAGNGIPDSLDDEALAPYDSDDDPAALVGRRIKVRWAGGTYYAGTVTNYDDLGHHVRCLVYSRPSLINLSRRLHTTTVTLECMATYTLRPSPCFRTKLKPSEENHACFYHLDRGKFPTRRKTKLSASTT